MKATLHTGDALTVLRTLPAGSARCCVTSPPYWGLRDYGTAGQLGIERTPEEYVANLVEVFREVRRVLADDGTLWLVLGDTYTQSARGRIGDASTLSGGTSNQNQSRAELVSRAKCPDGLKPKDLVGIPWRLAFALQADGWYLRRDIIWHKENPMPESVRDRPTSAHEYVFLLSKAARYHYDAAAIAEPGVTAASENYPARARATGRGQQGAANARGNDRDKSGGFPPRKTEKQRGHGRRHAGFNDRWDAMKRDEQSGYLRNARSVWTIATRPYPGAHFATFPEELARRCILAGSAPGDTVLDPFAGSGTVGAVATGHGRGAILIELNPTYVQLQQERIGMLLCAEA